MPTRTDGPNILVTILVVLAVALAASFLILHLHRDASSLRAAGVGTDVVHRPTNSR